MIDFFVMVDVFFGCYIGFMLKIFWGCVVFNSVCSKKGYLNIILVLIVFV